MHIVTEVIALDILVVGAGPAGLAAATVAAQAGADVVLVDGATWAGGRLALQTQPLQGPRSIFEGQNGVDFCRNLVNQASDAGVDIRLGTRATSITSLSGGGFSASLSGGKPTISARAVILSMGSNEPVPSLPGSELPGVMLSGDAQEMLNVDGKLPGKRIVMVGSDNAGLLISANLMDAGAEVVAVVEEGSRLVGRQVNLEPLLARGVQFLVSTQVLTASGTGSLELVELRNAASEVLRLDVDVMCLAGLRIPNMDLERPEELVLSEQAALGGLVPVHDKRMSTSATGLYVCGDSSGVESGAAALESGRIAGLSAAQDLGYQMLHAAGLISRAAGRLGYLRRGRRGSLRSSAKNALAAEHRKLA